MGRDGKPLPNPLALVQHLDDILPEKSILIGDGGDFIATASYIVRPRGPLCWLDPGAFGTLGVGGGFALGAKLARPDFEVWLLWGDGSAGYSIAEYDTFKRHNVRQPVVVSVVFAAVRECAHFVVQVPIIALVGNDAGWTQIEREQAPKFGDNVACQLLYTPYSDGRRLP
jgi:acetolactate synthase-like protein